MYEGGNEECPARPWRPRPFSHISRMGRITFYSTSTLHALLVHVPTRGDVHHVDCNTWGNVKQKGLLCDKLCISYA